jgi:uncharacterized membrane protein (UPF0127 family)
MQYGGLALYARLCKVVLKGRRYSSLSIPPSVRFLLLLAPVALAACGGAPGTESPQPVVTVGAPATESPQPVVTVGGASFKVELAITQDQRTQGLSGRANLAPGTGMLFVFDQEGRYSFWMKEMRFPLDLVWIGPSAEGCTVVDITPNAPPPAPGQSVTELPLYTPVAPARYVLEVNGGETEAAGVRIESRVEFKGSLAGLYGC